MARLIVLSLLLSACVTVRADLGLSLTIPGLASGVSEAINQGVINLVKANGTLLRMNPDMDRSGALPDLIQVVNYVTSPLNKLLGATMAGSTSKNSNSQEFFAALSSHTADTKVAIANALIAADKLQGTVRPAQYDEIRGNVSLIESNLPQLQETFTVLSTTVAVVKSSKEPVTSENVTIFFTRPIIDGLIYPLQNITRGVNGLATVVLAVVKDKMTSMNAIASINGTINSGSRSLAMVTMNFNRSVNEAGNFVVNNANGLYGSINQMYSSIVNRPQNFNGGDISKVSRYLSEVKTNVDRFSKDMGDTFGYLRDNVTSILNSQVDKMSQILLATATNISNIGYTSNSENADRCVTKYTNQLTQNPVQVNRLTACLQPEINGFNGFTGIYQLYRMLMDQTKTLGGSVSSNVLGRQCTQGMSDCVVTYFDYLHSLSQQVDDKLNINVQVVARETMTIQNRISACIMAITADIVDNARMVQVKSDNCLSTGTRGVMAAEPSFSKSSSKQIAIRMRRIEEEFSK
ncbi:uncharacterized protein LOC135703546 [Ochlerotatus camptorhynchus]|uniref:uncharacterized protein LOC135703546 n=1 Tax=Ochlerotatus camptorhynchus TaxID=644619 RepID=UPI0031D85034